MPQTSVLPLTYPDSGDHTRRWEHFQALAQDVQAVLLTQRYYQFSSSGKLNDGDSIASGLVVPNPGKAGVKVALSFVGTGGFHSSAVSVQPSFTGGPTNDAAPGSNCPSGQWVAIVRTAVYTFPDDSTDLTFGMSLSGGPAYIRGAVTATLVG